MGGNQRPAEGAAYEAVAAVAAVAEAATLAVDPAAWPLMSALCFFPIVLRALRVAAALTAAFARCSDVSTGRLCAWNPKLASFERADRLQLGLDVCRAARAPGRASSVFRQGVPMLSKGHTCPVGRGPRRSCEG